MVIKARNQCVDVFLLNFYFNKKKFNLNNWHQANSQMNMLIQIYIVVSFFLTLIYQIKSAYITFDTGIEERYEYYNHTDFYCLDNKNYSYTNIFKGEFESKPKIIISNYFYNIEYTRPTEYTFNITETTTTYFTTIVTCPQPKRFWGLKFTWIATNDERIEVINVFNQNMTNQGTKQYEYMHSNFNALQGFVTKFSLGFIGMLDFNFIIDSITSEKVYVTFTSSNSNLLSIGYQVVLGNTGAFQLDPIFRIYTDVNSSKTYDTGYIPIPSGITLIFPYCGIYYTNINNIRQERIKLVSNSSGIQYRYQSWYQSMVDLMLRKVWFNSINSQTFYPFICKKIRVSKLSNPWAQFQSQMKLQIKEINQIYTEAASIVQILEATQTLTLIVTFQCNMGQYIQGSILKCASCNDPLWYKLGSVFYIINTTESSQIKVKIRCNSKWIYYFINCHQSNIKNIYSSRSLNKKSMIFQIKLSN